MRARTGHPTERCTIAWSIALALLCLSQLAGVASAQIAGLSLKRGGELQPQDCATFGTLVTRAARDTTMDPVAAIRRGQEAALAGDHQAARDAYAEAARLDPSDARIAYHLARAYEELDNPRDALREYCRARALAPSAATAPDVDDRIGRMMRRLAQSPDSAARAFASGLAAFDVGEYPLAVDAFSAVLALRPGQVESTFDRALALALVDRRAEAIADFTRYALMRPSARDVPAVRDVIDRLRRPQKRVGGALLLGLLFPGGGLYYTGHPVQGVVATTLAAAGVLYAFSESRTEPAPCPGDTRPPCVRDDYTHLGTGLAIAGAVHTLALLEAVWLARRTQLRLSLSSGVSVPAPMIVPTARGARVSWRVRF